jgi:dTDP-4-amino-4,6-dideoxygalactose transaminase
MIEYENLYLSNSQLMRGYEEKFQEVLKKGWFILGNEVAEFENEFAKYCNTNFCIGVGNGLDAIILALRTLNLPQGSEVIVPSNTYIATVLAILEVGLKPVLVEPNIYTYNIDPNRIEEKINKKTRAIIVVHLYGKCADMTEVMPIAKKHSLYVIEDAAQAHGARIKESTAGSFGDMSAFSFYPTKNLGALGDAGCITTNNETFAKNLRRLRNYGSDVKYYNEIQGTNSRLDEIQAAFLRIKLPLLDEMNRHKRELAELYFKELNDTVVKPTLNVDFFDVYHIFNIRCKKRDELKQFLLDNKIKTEIHYPLPLYRQKAMAGLFKINEFPISDEIHNTTLSLPISYFHTKEDVFHICSTINTFFGD